MSALDGATTPPPFNTRVSNAGEFAAIWNAHDEAWRDEAIRRLMQSQDEAQACLIRDHDGLDHKLRAAEKRIWELQGAGSCWDEGPALLPLDADCAPPPPRCELRAGHLGAHRGGRAEWMTREPRISDEMIREALKAFWDHPGGWRKSMRAALEAAEAAR